MRVPGLAETVEELGAIVVSTNNGVPIMLRDIASVGVGQELRAGAATQNGREVVMSTVFMLGRRQLPHRGKRCRHQAG